MSETTETTNAAVETKVKFCEKSFEDGVLSFKFGNGVHLTLDVNTLEQEIQMELMGHGGLQKIGDSYAGAAGDYDFAVGAAKKVIDTLVSGSWKAAREGGESKPRTTELAEAISRLKNLELADAVALVSTLDEAQRKDLRGKDSVKSMIAKIRYEKAEKKAQAALDKGTDELDAILAGLN